MIAESTPFGGIDLNDTNTRIFNETDAWDRWFGRVISLINYYDIDMWSYINCQWDSQPMWHNVGFGDTRLSIDDYVMKQWNHYVIQSKGNQTFLMGNTMECGVSDENPMRETVNFEFSLRRPYSFLDGLQFSLFVMCFYFVFFILKCVVQSSFRQNKSKRCEATVSEKHRTTKQQYGSTGNEFINLL